MRRSDLPDDVRLECDVLVVGGGSAGSTAAIEAAEGLPPGRVILLEKAHIRRSGAIAIGMDGLNNAIVPGFATPEQYVREITMANDGIVDQRLLWNYAINAWPMIQQLDRWGVKFQKTVSGGFDVRKVHHKGAYVLPMPEGHDLKRILAREIRRREVRVVNRVMASRVLVRDGRAVGIAGVDTRTGAFATIRAKSVILACGASGRLGLPASGYLFGTYENPANAGDGYSMAFHAGAELSNIECFQINPLIKDYNGPACAYVTGPLGGHTVNAKGRRFLESDYWSGQMMLEFWRELHGPDGPVYLKLDHLAPETIREIEGVLHRTERPSRGRFHEGRGNSYADAPVEMHVSEIGLCSGHSASGVRIDERGATTVPGLFAAGDMASVPHNYLLGALVYGKIAAAHAVEHALGSEQPTEDVEAEGAERERVLSPLDREGGLPPHQVEYKIRRLVNDYLQPPKTEVRLRTGLEHFQRLREDVLHLEARDPHGLMRALEVGFILDCAEFAARSSLERKESRWGLYHYRLDHPAPDPEWFVHLSLRKGEGGAVEFEKRPVDHSMVQLSEEELSTYSRLRIPREA